MAAIVPTLAFNESLYFLLGVGLAVLGVVYFLTRNCSRIVRFAAPAAAAFAAMFAADFAFVGPVQYPAAMAIVSSVFAATLLVRCDGLTRHLSNGSRFLKSRVVHTSALVVAGGAFVTLAAVRSAPPEGDGLEGVDHRIEVPVAFHEIDGLSATTDAGTKIPMLIPNNLQDLTDPRMLERAKRSTTAAHQLIQTGSLEPAVNCHGWVFTMGRAWVSGAVVDSILKDNGYSIAKSPAVGDVVIYRSSENAVLHSGLVRTVTPEGRVLVESKWGSLGTYIHLAADTGYGERIQFYRTVRPTHLLRGLTPPSSGTVVARQG
jgi:hypothetical protein